MFIVLFYKPKIEFVYESYFRNFIPNVVGHPMVPISDNHDQAHIHIFPTTNPIAHPACKISGSQTLFIRMPLKNVKFCLVSDGDVAILEPGADNG